MESDIEPLIPPIVTHFALIREQTRFYGSAIRTLLVGGRVWAWGASQGEVNFICASIEKSVWPASAESVRRSV